MRRGIRAEGIGDGGDHAGAGRTSQAPHQRPHREEREQQRDQNRRIVCGQRIVREGVHRGGEHPRHKIHLGVGQGMRMREENVGVEKLARVVDERVRHPRDVPDAEAPVAGIQTSGGPKQRDGGISQRRDQEESDRQHDEPFTPVDRLALPTLRGVHAGMICCGLSVVITPRHGLVARRRECFGSSLERTRQPLHCGHHANVAVHPCASRGIRAIPVPPAASQIPAHGRAIARLRQPDVQRCRFAFLDRALRRMDRCGVRRWKKWRACCSQVECWRWRPSGAWRAHQPRTATSSSRTRFGG